MLSAQLKFVHFFADLSLLDQKPNASKFSNILWKIEAPNLQQQQHNRQFENKTSTVRINAKECWETGYI